MLDLSELEQWREGNRLEVKAAQGGLPGDVWPSVSAFANTNGGLIVLGVKENTKTHELFVLGLKDARKMLDAARNKAEGKAVDGTRAALRNVREARRVGAEGRAARAAAHPLPGR